MNARLLLLRLHLVYIFRNMNVCVNVIESVKMRERSPIERLLNKTAPNKHFQGEQCVVKWCSVTEMDLCTQQRAERTTVV